MRQLEAWHDMFIVDTWLKAVPASINMALNANCLSISLL